NPGVSTGPGRQPQESEECEIQTEKTEALDGYESTSLPCGRRESEGEGASNPEPSTCQPQHQKTEFPPGFALCCGDAPVCQESSQSQAIAVGDQDPAIELKNACRDSHGDQAHRGQRDSSPPDDPEKGGPEHVELLFDCHAPGVSERRDEGRCRIRPIVGDVLGERREVRQSIEASGPGRERVQQDENHQREVVCWPDPQCTAGIE